MAGAAWSQGALAAFGQDTLHLLMSREPPGPPSRFVLRLAAFLAQLGNAACLLSGTIAFVLVWQNQSAGAKYVIAWAGVAMLGIIFGGFMPRGGMISLLATVLITGGFGGLLAWLPYPVLASLLRILPPGDIDMIFELTSYAGFGLIGVAALGLLSIPQAVKYGRWLHTPDATRTGYSMMFAAVMPVPETDRGWQAPSGPRTHGGGTGTYQPVPSHGQAPMGPSRTSVWVVPSAPPEIRRSRRRMYFALAGFAIGVGAGTGVLVSGKQKRRAPVVVKVDPTSTDEGRAKSDGPPAEEASTKSVTTTNPGSGSGSAGTNPVTESNPGSGSGSGAEGSGSAVTVAPTMPARPTPAVTATQFLETHVGHIVAGDVAELTKSLHGSVFGFGIDGTAVAEGRDAVAKLIAADFGEKPKIEKVYAGVGDDGDRAWIALELKLNGRKVAVSELAVFEANTWTIRATCWGELIPDADATQRAILFTLPEVSPVPAGVDGPPELSKAVRDGFGEKSKLLAMRSAHPQAVNIGSGPGQRIVGGEKILARKGGGYRISPRGSIRIVATDKETAFAALVVNFTTKSKTSAMDITQPLRMLAILRLEPEGWRIVSAHWSNGGPIR